MRKIVAGRPTKLGAGVTYVCYEMHGLMASVATSTEVEPEFQAEFRNDPADNITQGSGLSTTEVKDTGIRSNMGSEQRGQDTSGYVASRAMVAELITGGEPQDFPGGRGAEQGGKKAVAIVPESSE